MVALSLRFCARAFSCCGKWGPLSIAVCGPLTIAASLVERRLSSWGSRAQLLRGMWDLPRPGLEPMSPALAGRFSTTAPPGKPNSNLYGYHLNIICSKKMVLMTQSKEHTLHFPFSFLLSLALPLIYFLTCLSSLLAFKFHKRITYLLIYNTQCLRNWHTAGTQYILNINT